MIDYYIHLAIRGKTVGRLSLDIDSSSSLAGCVICHTLPGLQGLIEVVLWRKPHPQMLLMKVSPEPWNGSHSTARNPASASWVWRTRDTGMWLKSLSGPHFQDIWRRSHQLLLIVLKNWPLQKPHDRHFTLLQSTLSELVFVLFGQEW